MTQTLLSAHAVRKIVRDGTATAVLLDGVDFSINTGEQVALTGASGSGKSTLLQIIGALDMDFEGDVRVQGESVRGKSDASLAALRNSVFGFVFQAYNLLAHLNAVENVLLPARFGPGVADTLRAQQLLERVGLRGKAHRRPASLSGGERQRVAIARALYMQPKLVLCDEPTGNLDRQTAHGIAALFSELARDGVALLIATHDTELAKAASRTLTLAQGKLQ